MKSASEIFNEMIGYFLGKGDKISPAYCPSCGRITDFKYFRNGEWLVGECTICNYKRSSK